jgi:hypothetical protein
VAGLVVIVVVVVEAVAVVVVVVVVGGGGGGGAIIVVVSSFIARIFTDISAPAPVVNPSTKDLRTVLLSLRCAMVLVQQIL